jgi:hypothetical protein
VSRKVEQSIFPLWRGSDPNIWLSRLPTKIKNTTLHAEGILGLEGREEKNNENKG